MKFAHEFMHTLESEEFPPHWQAAAIQYRQLKKCIKRVQKELSELGLSADTLKLLISEGEAEREGPVLRYVFDGTVQSFHPKLVLKVQRTDGLQFDEGLSEETRAALQKLVKLGRQTTVAEDDDDGGSCAESISGSSDSSNGSDGGLAPHVTGSSEDVPVSTVVEIPLFADVEFFRTLSSELSSLEAVQLKAKSSIEDEISMIGDSVSRIALPTFLVSRSDLYPWREVFRLYLEASIFFSNLEIEAHKERSVEDSEKRLQRFSSDLTVLGLRKQFKNRGSRVLLSRFLATNEEVLRVMRFQAINKVAMRKILKKFDKRTSLGAKQTFPKFAASNQFLATQLAKAICFTMSTRLLSLIPQLDDYLCPICQSICIKPVRLSCSHVFCVRCLVKLQRANKKSCPMCRGDAVMKANASNVDTALLNFLKGYFPKEAKQKQKENDREVVQEQWVAVGKQSLHAGSGGGECVVM